MKSPLVVVLLAGLGLSWVARNVRRFEGQPAINAQFRRTGVQVVKSKPSTWALIAEVLRNPASLEQLGIHSSVGR